jgi:flagellar hook-associated protein 1 FlgK
MSIFSVGVSGLNAAQNGLLTTGHNIANASTPGYNRQQIYQTTNQPMFTGAGFVGQGTNVETIRRIYSQQLSEQVLSAQSGSAEMDSYLSQINQISNLMADPDAGLSPAMSDFFKAVQEMAANPASIPARQAALSGSESLVARFQAIDQRMTDVRTGVNGMISSEVSAINSYAEQLANINQRIISAQAAGPNQPPNDLLDQRDQLIADLNKVVRVSTVTQSDGTYSVFIGNGQPIVVGTLAYNLEAVAAPDDPEQMIVAIKAPNGSTINLPDSLITGGTLGGLIAFRNESLDLAQNSLGRIALTLATNFNEQHMLGQDLAGALGGNFFDISNAGPVSQPNSGNTGTAVLAVTVGSIGNLTTSDYRLNFDGANYTLLRLSDNTSQAYTLGTTVDGINITLGSGAPNAGDSFLIQPTRNGSSGLAMAITDPRAIAAAAPIRTATSLANKGTGSIDAGTVIDTTNAAFATPGTLTPPILIRFDTATSYTIYDNTNPLAPAALEGPIAYTPGTFPVPEVFPTPGALDYGYRIKISGAPSAGDEFTVGKNSSGVSDNRNAVLLASLQTQSKMEGATATYQSSYSAIVSQIGNKAREVEITGKAQQTLYEQAETSRAQLSGVNLDEEAANLLRYQQAYQAAAKMMDVASTLFDEIIALGR